MTLSKVLSKRRERVRGLCEGLPVYHAAAWHTLLLLHGDGGGGPCLEYCEAGEYLLQCGCDMGYVVKGLVSRSRRHQKSFAVRIIILHILSDLVRGNAGHLKCPRGRYG